MTSLDPFSRYERQWRFAPIGMEGQERLSRASVLIVGCGALGSVSSELLARAGIGKLRLVDRDYLEWNNLQRQSLYTESDIERGLPKAIAAAEHLRAINSQIDIDPIVGDVRWDTVRSWADGFDLIVDGTDNFETRFLLNDLSCELGIPWSFAGCLGAEGQAMLIVPGTSACLRCLMPDGPPLAGESATCDSAGILAPIIHVMASLQVTSVLQWLSGSRESVSSKLTVVDLWNSGFRTLDLSSLDRASCPTCSLGERAWLSGERGSMSVVLCGRNSVQVTLGGAIDLEALPSRFPGIQPQTSNRFLMRWKVGEHVLTVFRDGRVIVGGVSDPVAARSIVSRQLGM